MRGIVFALLLLPAAAVADPAPAAAPAPTVESGTSDVDLAKAHFNTGQIYYERQLYDQAAREFEEAYRLAPRTPLLYNIGKAYDGAQDYARALAAYRRYLHAPDSAGSSDLPTVQARVAQLEHLVGKVTVHTQPGAQVTLDGSALGTAPLPPVEVNPGGHELVVSSEGYRSFRGKLVAAPDRAVTIEAPLTSLVKVEVKVVRVPEPEKRVPVYQKWWLWTAVGVVVVVGAVTAGVLASQTPPVSGPFAQLPELR